MYVNFIKQSGAPELFSLCRTLYIMPHLTTNKTFAEYIRTQSPALVTVLVGARTSLVTRLRNMITIKASKIFMTENSYMEELTADVIPSPLPVLAVTVTSMAAFAATLRTTFATARTIRSLTVIVVISVELLHRFIINKLVLLQSVRSMPVTRKGIVNRSNIPGMSFRAKPNLPTALLTSHSPLQTAITKKQRWISERPVLPTPLGITTTHHSIS